MYKFKNSALNQTKIMKSVESYVQIVLSSTLTGHADHSECDLLNINVQIKRKPHKCPYNNLESKSAMVTHTINHNDQINQNQPGIPIRNPPSGQQRKIVQMLVISCDHNVHSRGASSELQKKMESSDSKHYRK